MITNMVSKESLQMIKQEVNGYIGQTVMVKSHLGRNRCEYKEGTITNTYANVFNFMDANTNKNSSYSYTDIVTSDLEITFPNGESMNPCEYFVPLNARF